MADEPRPSTQSLSPDDIVRRYWEHVWIRRDLSVLGDLYNDPTIRHTANGSRVMTLAELEATLSDALRAVRGESFTVDQLTIDGAIAWLRLTLHGMNLANMSPTTITWLAQYRLENGRIAETWGLHQSGLDWHL